MKHALSSPTTLPAPRGDSAGIAPVIAATPAALDQPSIEAAAAGLPLHVRRDWRHRASCRSGSGVDPELFYPVGTTGPDVERQVNEAKEICRICPVATACLVDALISEDYHGIRAGLTGDEREAISRQRQRVARELRVARNEGR